MVLSGVIYVWAQSLASDAGGKATPRLTFKADAITDQGVAEDGMWYWQVTVLSADRELAAQAVFVKMEWTDSSGKLNSYSTNLANPDGVYGFIPSNSPDAMVTYKDSIDCNVDCSAGFGQNDVVRMRMVDPATGVELPDNTRIVLQYAPAGGTANLLMEYQASQTNIKPV